MADVGQFFYANGLEASASPYDISFKFLRNVPKSLAPGVAVPSAGASVETGIETADTLVVSMSPSHAKAMLPALFQMVAQYETTYGKIPLPTDQQAVWDAGAIHIGKSL